MTYLRITKIIIFSLKNNAYFLFTQEMMMKIVDILIFKKNCFFIFLFFLLSFVLIGCRDSSQQSAEEKYLQKQRVADVDEQNTKRPYTPLDHGREIYDKMCATCHGASGSGRGTRPGPSLQRAEFTYGKTKDDIKKSIRDGRPDGMPFFHHVLSEEEIEAVTIYVLSLKE